MVDAQVTEKKSSKHLKINFWETIWSSDKIFWDFSKISIQNIWCQYKRNLRHKGDKSVWIDMDRPKIEKKASSVL